MLKKESEEYYEIKDIRLTEREMLLVNPYNHPIVIKNGIGCYKIIAR